MAKRTNRLADFLNLQNGATLLSRAYHPVALCQVEECLNSRDARKVVRVRDFVGKRDFNKGV